VSRSAVVADTAWASWCSKFLRRWPWSLPSPPASQIQDPKTKVDPASKNILSRSVEVLHANPSEALTWRASCRCFSTDSLPRGYPRQFLGFGICWTRRLTQETVDLYWFGPLWSDSLYFQSALAFTLDWLLWLCYREVPIASLYIGRDSYGAVTILVGSKESVLILIT
jgi:hypothetical protein